MGESPVQFECKVNEVIALGEEGGAGNLIVCEVVKLHINEAVLDENGQIDQHKIDLVSRMGGNWYSRANLGMFEVPKPLASIGIGIDNIPFDIRNSKVLTGNDLGVLGNVERVPSKEEIEEFVESSIKIRELISADDIAQIHAKAQEMIANNDVVSAWKLLLAK